MEPTESYLCKSYYDDNNVLQDCTCGMCREQMEGSNANEHDEEYVRNKIIEAIKAKRPDDADKAEEIADFILSQPYINKDTYETFLTNAGLL